MTNQIQNSNDKKIRINKFLAQNGLGSRRGVEDLILAKKVKINNQIAKLSDKIDPAKDKVEVENKIIKPETSLVYYAVNKPVGYTSSVRDVYAEKLITDLAPKEPKVYPVGRLDKDSRGLIILTNDGDLTNQLTHPRFKHEKEYIVKIKSQSPDIQSKIQKLKKGVRLTEGLAKADKIAVLDINKTQSAAKIKITLHQGWKRQIRRMCERAGLLLLDLNRTKFGKLDLGDLGEGEHRIIQKCDIM